MDGRDQDMAANTSRWALGNASAHGHRRSPEASSRAKCGMQLPVWGGGPARRACVTRLSVPFVLPRLTLTDRVTTSPSTTLILMAVDL